MQTRFLGKTGVPVSNLCLGAMMFGEWGTKDHDESIRIIHAALDAGIDFIDTADVYSAGESEKIVGKALAGRRDDVVLATKFFMPMGTDPNERGGSRRWIIRAAENSLRRLDTDYIDLYQVHRPSQDTDVEETLGALTDLVRQGKVRYLGSSSYAASQIVEAQWTARDRRLERFVTEQPPYSILVRGIEADVLPTARWTRGSTSSTPPTSTPGASPSGSSARPWPGGATTSCWPRNSSCPWEVTRTSGAAPAGGSGTGRCSRSQGGAASSRPRP